MKQGNGPDETAADTGGLSLCARTDAHRQQDVP